MRNKYFSLVTSYFIDLPTGSLYDFIPSNLSLINSFAFN